MIELPKRFNFQEIDDKWSRYWAESGIYHATSDSDKSPYTIVIPPPNITGILHMGHALNNTLQDIMIRYKRMKGLETLWMPGTDHAGIATQNVVEKQLAKEGKKRHDLGRELFLERLWAWQKQYGDTIIHQLKKLGSSCDWQRSRFTMDEKYSLAVRKVFVELYKKDLIYQGQYIINWCPRCHTALSDEEAEHQEHEGHLYHIRYPFKDDPRQGLVVATTRPETMLGDTAVAVNPNDERYKDMIGRTLVLPLLNREIPVIADDFVDPAFGTGAVKVTPAHDPNDFDMGKRHELPFINVMYPDGRINKEGGKFAEMDRYKAREAVLAELKEAELLVKITPHKHAVGHCYRCNTVVEPYLSKQWFVRMKPLAEPALAAVKDGRIKFYPERWTKVYLNWMENIRDWCISRQIWWGHRIPVWYCHECGEVIVTMDDPASCPKCGSKKIEQEEDVMDTWFSSWLWPFATLGWPEKNRDLEFFYPTTALFTASEIIFFWVARMIMAGLEFMGDIPFSDVYIHGTVRDAQGRKMSKSLGNAIDPLEIINEYGADALRFSLIINSGQDLYISKEKFEIGRNFANKIWNAGRLILMNSASIDQSFDLKSALKNGNLELSDKWIVSSFNNTVRLVTDAIERYRFSEAESLIYDFFWAQFCDWYLEIIKDRWNDVAVQNIAYKIFTETLKLVHPFMPFVTEEIWSQCYPKEKLISLQKWPGSEPDYTDNQAEYDMAAIKAVVIALRNIRSQWNIKPAETVKCLLVSAGEEERKMLELNKNLISRLAKVEMDISAVDPQDLSNSATSVVGTIKCIVPLKGIIDIAAEKAKLEKRFKQQLQAIDTLNKRLSNPGFTEKAPVEVVESERGRLDIMKKEAAELENLIKMLA
jgi:valyl-tRNA synthetase